MSEDVLITVRAFIQSVLILAMVLGSVCIIVFATQATSQNLLAFELTPYSSLSATFVVIGAITSSLTVIWTSNYTAPTNLSIVFIFSPILVVCWSFLASMTMWSLIREISTPVTYSWLIGAIGGIFILYILQRRTITSAPEPQLNISRYVHSTFAVITLVLGISMVIFTPAVIEQTIFVESERFLVPIGFEGPIIVVYNQPNGQPMKYDGKARIYEVPNDGLLLSQFSFSKHPVLPQFWYVENGIQIRQVPFYSGPECGREIVSDPVIACPTGLLTGTPFEYVGFTLGPSSKQRVLWDEFAERLDTIRVAD